MHVAVEQNGLPISVVISPANRHDSTQFCDVVNSISMLHGRNTRDIEEIYADKAYDAQYIREYLEKRKIKDCIPHRKNNTTVQDDEYDDAEKHRCNKIRYVVERFFAWLKNGFRRLIIRYERKSENYLGLLNIASFLMYCRVLR